MLGSVHGRDRRPLLLLGAHLRLVLQVDIAAPAEQDQRHVERQRGACNANLGTEICRRSRRCWKKVLPFQMSSITAVMSTTSTTASRCALSRRELGCAVTTGTSTLATNAAVTARTLNKFLSETEIIASDRIAL